MRARVLCLGDKCWLVVLVLIDCVSVFCFFGSGRRAAARVVHIYPGPHRSGESQALSIVIFVRLFGFFEVTPLCLWRIIHRFIGEIFKR